MKSLRSQLILSHVLPQVIVLPLLVLGMGYIIESRVLLADLANDFRRAALLAAQEAAVRPAIWQDAGQAEDFVQIYSDSRQREIILIRPDGSVQAAPSDVAAQGSPLSPGDLNILLSGETLVKSSYNISLDGIHVEALAPVLDARRVVGIVRVTDRLGNVYDNFRSIRNLEIVAFLLSLTAAVGLGIWLARRIELRLRAVISAVELVADAGSAPAMQGAHPERMPSEFAGVFASVNALSERLHASEAARKQLLANLVHEVARPLGALQAAVHALQQGAAENPALRREFLQGMDDQIDRLKPLLDNLASLYTLSGRPVELQAEVINLGVWLRQILAPWQAMAQAGGLNWRCDLPDDLPEVSLDPIRMEQVIGNLVANAIKYTPSGGCIQVAAGSEADRVWVSVEDNGVGITPQELQKIFEPFYRSPRVQRFPQGMGLGLSIAMDIVRLHDGELRASSEEGRGSCFTVYLPV